MKRLIFLVVFLSSCAPSGVDTKIKTDQQGQYQGAEATVKWVF